jgi:hypothetical protein
VTQNRHTYIHKCQISSPLLNYSSPTSNRLLEYAISWIYINSYIQKYIIFHLAIIIYFPFHNSYHIPLFTQLILRISMNSFNTSLRNKSKYTSILLFKNSLQKNSKTAKFRLEFWNFKNFSKNFLPNAMLISANF